MAWLVASICALHVADLFGQAVPRGGITFRLQLADAVGEHAGQGVGDVGRQARAGVLHADHQQLRIAHHLDRNRLFQVFRGGGQPQLLDHAL